MIVSVNKSNADKNVLKVKVVDKGDIFCIE